MTSTGVRKTCTTPWYPYPPPGASTGEATRAPAPPPFTPPLPPPFKMGSPRDDDDRRMGPTPGGGKNAPQIFFEGVENLKKDPTGWLSGAPSPLNSGGAQQSPRNGESTRDASPTTGGGPQDFTKGMP